MSHDCKEGAKKGNVYCKVGALLEENATLKAELVRMEAQWREQIKRMDKETYEKA